MKVFLSSTYQDLVEHRRLAPKLLSGWAERDAPLGPLMTRFCLALTHLRSSDKCSILAQ
jgi:hypothetical protein